MITAPLNDQECLGSITEVVRSLVDQQAPELHTLARELGSCSAAIRWIRSLPQRDDVGAPGDGPRIDACAPPQRLRLPAPDPNCVERAALYLVLGEFLEPRPARRLATIDTPVGRHTLPVENDRPVVLDPRVPRNCAQAGIDVLGAIPAPTDVASCASWVCNVAAEPAHQLPGGPRRLRKAGAALAGAIQGVALCPTAVDDVAMVLALAAREAHQWGPAGIGVVDRVAQAVLDLERATGGTSRGAGGDAAPSAGKSARNAVELKVGRYRLRPAIPTAVGAALRALGVVGMGAGTAVARAQLATLGITPAMLSVFESELNKGGLTIGALAKPTPPVHSFAALTSDALVARHLERAGAA
jgi:hypothetical protein